MIALLRWHPTYPKQWHPLQHRNPRCTILQRGLHHLVVSHFVIFRKMLPQFTGGAVSAPNTRSTAVVANELQTSVWLFFYRESFTIDVNHSRASIL